MDSLITASARALAAGDPLGALKRIALRDDAPALALRGIAMAQLGDYPRARELLRRAARAFRPGEALSHARCVVAEAEVALAMRDLGAAHAALPDAIDTLAAHGEYANAVHARLVLARRALLLGRVDDAGAALAAVGGPLAPPLAAVAALAQAELALRSLQVGTARAHLAQAAAAARAAGIPALLAEVEEAHAVLARPAARLCEGGGARPLRLDEVRAVLDANRLVLDGCRRGLRSGDAWRPLATRPILFTLAQALAEAWPHDVSRTALIARAFRLDDADETLRARLRVEIGRLRAQVAPLARIEASADGYLLAPADGRTVAMLAPPIDGEQAALIALLADGQAWSTSALALALGDSQRTVQRALAELEAAGQVRSLGRGRACRWLAPPLAPFATTLLLPAAIGPG